jgi:DNA-directed RNA polymerase subunit RPC12/RpoP
MKTLYKCSSCLQEFKQKKPFTAHQILCQIISEKKILTSNPSNEVIYVLLEEMVHKYTNLTKEVEDMKKYIQKTKKKMEMDKYLNQNIRAHQSFTIWKESIKIEQSDLQLIFDSNLALGIIQILEKNCKENDPIIAIQQKMYIYEEESWNQLEDKKFCELIQYISKKILTLYKDWQKQHEFDESRVLKIVQTPQRLIQTKVKAELLKKIKIDIKQVYEIELER